MLKTAELLELLKITLFTGYIAGERPNSLLITAKVESGKTQLVSKMRANRGVLYLTDATPVGITRHYADALFSQQIRHIIIPDLLVPLSRFRDTVASFVAFFNALIEEGVVEIRTQFINVVPQKMPTKCGLITTIAPSYLMDARHKWSGIGFLSRLLPISYSYSTSSVIQILESIVDHEYYGDKGIKLQLPTQDIQVGCAAEYGRRILPYTNRLATAANLYGFRLQKQLQVAMMGSALAEGRTSVRESDFEKVAQLTNFINLDYTSI